jgi:hypothetical protein
MMWFVRCLLWGTPLAFLAYQIAGFYHRALLISATAVFGLTPSPEALAAVDLSAANVLAMYAAMCLASGRAPWMRRLAAIGIGLVVLVAIEWSCGVAGIGTVLQQMRSGNWPAGAERLRDGILDLLRWISVPLVWLALLGKTEIPALARGFAPPRNRKPVDARAGRPAKPDDGRSLRLTPHRPEH